MQFKAENGRLYRVSVRRATVRDGIEINRARRENATRFADAEEMLLVMYNYPILAHTCNCLEVSDDDGDTWSKLDFTEDLFLELEEAFVLAWLTKVYEVNPQHMSQTFDELKKIIQAMTDAS